MHEHWALIFGLATATLSIRVGGYLLGTRLPKSGAWAGLFSALPGTLIVALLTVLLMQGGQAEWFAACLSILVAILTNSLPVTMISGISAIWFLRTII